MRFNTIIGISLVVSTLTGCGGGGADGSSNVSGSETTVSNLSFPVDSTLGNYLDLSRSSTFRATSQGRSFEFTYAFNPQSDTTFEGMPSKRTRVTGTLSENGAELDASVVNVFFNEGPFSLNGYTTENDPDNQNYFVSIDNSIAPAFAKVGSQGPIAQMNAFSDSSKNVPTGRDIYSYSVEPDTATTAFICLNSNTFDVNNTQIFSSKECAKIDASGVFIGFRFITTPFENGVEQEAITFE